MVPVHPATMKPAWRESVSETINHPHEYFRQQDRSVAWFINLTEFPRVACRFLRAFDPSCGRVKSKTL
jgi:hypothetical protein